MAIRYVCDRCGKPLGPNGIDRFVVRIEVFAAADQLVINDEDLARDHREEITQLVKQLDQMSPDQIEDQTYRAFRFDLCRTCQGEYLRGPIRKQ
jgi:hypothetical protein